MAASKMQAPSRGRRAALAVAGAVLVAATAAVQAVGMTAATAATVPVGSVEVITAQSGFSTGPSKTVEAICPANRPRVLGGGYTSTGLHIVVNELRPVAGATDRYRVTAGFDEVGTSASWNLLAYAYCSSAAPGWQLVSATSTTTSQSFNQTIATCPSGKAVVGTGGRLNGGIGQVHLVTQGIGGLAPNRMSAGGLEDLSGFSGNWSVTGFAVCVTFASALDVTLVSDQTASDTVNPKGKSVTCPSGTRLTGSAAWANLPGNLFNLRPNTNTPTSVTASARVDIASSFSWDLIVYGFCVK